MLDPGGTGGGGGGDSTDDAADELTERDRGSGDGGGGGIDAGDVTDIVEEDTSGGGSPGGTSDDDSNDAADELTDRDPGSGGGGDSSGSDSNQDAREELTDRDQGSGDGSSGSQDRSTDEGITSGGGETTTGDGGENTTDNEAARDELTERDEGSDVGDQTPAEEELTETDPGSEDVRQRDDERVEERAEELAEEAVDQPSEGIEDTSGIRFVDGRLVDVSSEAEALEATAIEQAEFAEGRSDVAIIQQGGSLVAVPTQAAAERLAAQDFEEAIRLRRGRALGGGAGGVEVVDVQANAEGEVDQAELDAVEQQVETTGVTVPTFVPVVGGREVTGTTRDVEVTQAEDGEIEVTEQEQFGDFDIEISPQNLGTAGLLFAGPAGAAAGAVAGNLNRGTELETVTGAAGDAFMDVGSTTGDVLARELVVERQVIPGAIIEERLTGDTDFVESATRGTPEGITAIGDQALNLPQETAEFVAEGVSRTATGGVSAAGDFVGEAGSAAVGRAIMTGESAVANPGRFTGQLGGSVLASGGTLAVASRVGGPTTARAASVAIQPGEELAIAAARRGVVPSRAARAVPGVSRGQLTGDSSFVTKTGVRRFLSDERGQADLTMTRRDDAETTSELSEEIQAELERMERGVKIREAERRGEQRAREATEERAMEDEPVRSVSGQDPDTIYVAEEGDFRTVSRGDPAARSRSGPTQAQQDAFRSSSRSESDDLSPRERMLEAQRERQQQAQEPEVRVDEELETETERLEQAQTAEAETETAPMEALLEQSRQSEGVVLLEEAQAMEAVEGMEDDATATEVAEDTRPMTAEEVAQATEPVTRQDIETMQETDTDQLLETETRTETDTGTETRQETRQETRLETDPRVEERVETRVETLVESRSETRREADFEPLEDDDGMLEDLGAGGEDFEETFEFDIATAEEVLSGDTS
jgi:hypothetical protein